MAEELAGPGPATIHLRIPIGADWRTVLEFEDDNGNPVDCTGWTLTAQVRETYRGALLAAFTFDTQFGDVHQAEMAMNAPTTGGLGEGSWVWDLWRERDGVVRPLLTGAVVAVPTVTRS